MADNLRAFPISQWRGSAFDPHQAALAILNIGDPADRRSYWFRHLAGIGRAARKLGGLDGEALEQALRDFTAAVQAEINQIKEDRAYGG